MVEPAPPESAQTTALQASEALTLAVVGAAECGPELAEIAFRTGAECARRGAWLLTGGRGGVMAAASRGARTQEGRVVGILPGSSAEESPPNDAVELALYTGLGQARNLVLVLSARAVIAIGGGWGTLSEVALALKHRIPVVTLASWNPVRPDRKAEPLLFRASDPVEAVAMALAQVRGDQSRPNSSTVD